MRQSLLITALLLTWLTAPAAVSSAAGLEDFFKTVLNQSASQRSLDESDIVNGLRQALEIGSRKAVDAVSRTDGFFRQPDIKIWLPEKLQRMESLMRKIGLGSQVDAFVLSMNRAAEKAAPEAKALFLDALRQMTFDDARRIWKGRDDEATRYFREKTEAALGRRFKPIVHESLSQVGATRIYRQLASKISALPFTESVRVDLDGYVTRKSLDGLFWMVAGEERKIRSDPAARVTDLLKQVFNRPEN